MRVSSVTCVLGAALWLAGCAAEDPNGTREALRAVATLDEADADLVEGDAGLSEDAASGEDAAEPPVENPPAARVYHMEIRDNGVDAAHPGCSALSLDPDCEDITWTSGDACADEVTILEHTVVPWCTVSGRQSEVLDCRKELHSWRASCVTDKDFCPRERDPAGNSAHCQVDACPGGEAPTARRGHYCAPQWTASSGHHYLRVDRAGDGKSARFECQWVEECGHTYRNDTETLYDETRNLLRTCGQADGLDTAFTCPAPGSQQVRRQRSVRVWRSTDRVCHDPNCWFWSTVSYEDSLRNAQATCDGLAALPAADRTTLCAENGVVDPGPTRAWSCCETRP